MQISNPMQIKSEFNNELKGLKADQEFIDWVGEKTFKDAWRTCERGDWMLWYWATKYPDDRMIFEAKARCAELDKRLMKDERSLAAVQAAHDYAAGKIDKSALRMYADAAVSAFAAAAFAAAAAHKTTLKQCADICREVFKLRQ